MSKIIAIVGATGTQGGSIIAALENNPAYKIRALTRNPNSDKAKALASRGVEVIAADVNDEASLVKAFDGTSVVFAVTDFFEPFARVGAETAMDIEYQQGINLARAAAQTASLELYIWSTLPDSRTLSDGKVVVPHFAAKARVDEFIKKDKALLAKTVFLWITFYATNLTYPPFTPFLAKPTGKLLAVTPVSASTQIASLGSISNVGTAVAGLVATDLQAFFTGKTPTNSPPAGGKYVHLMTTFHSVQDYYSTWAQAIGKDRSDVKVLSISLAEYEALFAEWGTEMGLMMQFWELAGPKKAWSTVGQGDVLVDSRELLGEANLVSTDEAFGQVAWGSIF